MRPMPRWLLALAMTAAIAGGSSLARPWLQKSVEARLTRKFEARLAALDEHEAVKLVHRLAVVEGDWLELLVAASADERSALAAAAEAELREEIDRWTKEPEERSESVALLAGLLAEQAPRLAPERRLLAHALALRLIDWPINSRRVDAARLIADCQTVLLLPRADATVVRVAAAPVIALPEPQADPPSADEQPPRPFTPTGGMRISDE
jgi:hypothetical protein